jgi:Protein of unknown function (DUF3574)
LASLALLAACAPVVPAPEPAPSAAAPAPYQCLLPSEHRMLVAELFFGRSIKGGGFVTEAEWSRFVIDTVIPNFPDGYTVFDGMGGWRDTDTGRAERDPPKILLIAADRAPDLAGRLQNVIDVYKARFRQKSIGIITRDSCAAF